MDRALVVVDSTESHESLLREAADCTSGTPASLLLVSFISEESFHQDQETLQQIASAESTSYGADAPIEAARGVAEAAGRDALGADAEFETMGAVADDDEQADRIVAIAAEEGCDHVFLTGRRRSPTGKALFGDRAQKVLLNFDGYVTVAME
ncbi:universal stress protein [Haloarchaeobius sp. DFWS5]|uniref:universal stress protein n=1 Tax=Haloarchaeobius sp. DFWS5 TaxID=3446114 RepID=UPI003EBCF809